jgi:hypothetical protein
MGICWHCYWGWPKPVADIYDEACNLLEDPDGFALRFGPGHIVWEDENWDSAEWCLEHFDKYSERLDKKEKGIVYQSLIKLAAIPLKERDICPENYDDVHPEMFPPPIGVVMVRR